MKKTIFILFATLAFTVSAFSQKEKSFRGIITYSTEYKGLSAAQANVMPTEQEIKFYDNRCKLDMNMGGQSMTMLMFGDKKEMYQLIGFTPMGKIALKITEADMKEMSEHKEDVKLTDETKTICGYTCKKAIASHVNDAGETITSEIWYAPELGSSAAMFGLKNVAALDGLFLEFTSTEGAITVKYVAKEVKKGKVKETDFLLPSDYSVKTMEELKQMMGGGSEEE